MKRLARFAPAACALGLALFAGAYTPLNSDLGWTLRDGARAAHGALARRNTESFTEPDRPVVSYQWLFSAASFLVHRAAGAAGLVLMKWALLALTALALAGAVGEAASHPLARLVALGVSAPLLGLGFLFVRAQIATYALVALVEWAALCGRRRALWSVVPLFALWPNLHGGFLLGLALAVAMGGALRLEAPATTKAPGTAELGAMALCSALATLANPYGIRLHLQALALVRDPGRSLDHEWTPVWRLASLLPGEWEALALAALALVLALVFVPRARQRLWVLALLLLLVPTAERHLRLVPLLAAPLVAAALEAALARGSESARATLARSAAIAGALVAAVALALFGSTLPRSLRFHGFPPPNPAPAIMVLKLNHLAGNVWNDFNWGGLLLWLDPEVKVACDGRFDQAYSGEVRREVIDFGHDGRDPLAELIRAGADLVLLPRTNPALMLVESVYRPLYCDAGTCLLSRRAADLALVRHGLRLPDPTVTPEELFDSPGR